MIWRLLKKLLSAVVFTVHYEDGDIVHIRIVYGGKTVFDRKIDVMPNI
jgi:hypothetical protein